FRRGCLDGGVIANVTGRERSSTARASNFLARFTQRLLAAADQKHQGTESGKTQRHGFSEPRASAGQKNRASLQHACLKHFHRLGWKQDCSADEAVSPRFYCYGRSSAGMGRPMALAYSAANRGFAGNSWVSSSRSF